MSSAVFQRGSAKSAQPALCSFLDCVGIALAEKGNITSGSNRPGKCNKQMRVAEFLVPSDARVISTLRYNAAIVASQAGATADILRDIEIAVGEALSNAYKHGSPEKGCSLILMKCAACDRAFAVEIRDEGSPFDPRFVTEPDPHSLREDGLGIYLMHSVMDVVEIECGLPGNRVRMIKWFC